MITVIYPDKDTDLERYSNINSDEIIVYDNTGSINTDFKKENTVDIFSRADNIIFTQNCIINEKYDIGRNDSAKSTAPIPNLMYIFFCSFSDNSWSWS